MAAARLSQLPEGRRSSWLRRLTEGPSQRRPFVCSDSRLIDLRSLTGITLD